MGRACEAEGQGRTREQSHTIMEGWMTDQEVEIRRLEREQELGLLEPLWLALHRHHRGVMRAGTLVADDAVSWTRRHELYGEWFAAGDALVLLAERAGAPVGYALAHLQEGPDDTFAVGSRYAELFSLSVAPEARGAGIGTRLLDELDRRLAELGIVDLVVAVMTDNVDALRFYERRGLRPTETYFWRVAAARR
jgi:ribosomal protein S18 acetylase RimI-like enzyme